MPRKVSEWIAKHDDQAIPPRVRVRVFDAHGGKCALSGRTIHAGDKWQLNHKIALIEGGEHRESNLEPVLVEPHKAETKRQMALKKKVNRTKAKHIGAVQPKGELKSRGFARSEKKPRIDKSAIDKAAVNQGGTELQRRMGV